MANAIDETRPMDTHRAVVRERMDTGDLSGWAITISLAIVFLWFGGIKFTDYGAQGTAGFVANSPFIGWAHALFGLGGTARVLGVYEIGTGLLILGRFINPRLSIFGGAMAMLTFVITLSFMLTTPGVVQSGFTIPLALSAVPGEFLLKDIVLLAASFWVFSASRAETAARRG